MSKLWILLIVIGVAISADFQAQVQTSEGVNGTLIHVEDSDLILQRITLETFPVETYLRRFGVSSDLTVQTYSSSLVQIGDWNPPSHMCCRNNPISSAEGKSYTLAQIQPGLIIDFEEQTLEVLSVEQSGTLPQLIDQAQEGFAQVEAVCPLYCPAQMEAQLVMDFSGSISSTEFAKFTQFVQKLTNRILIDSEHVQLGMVMFGGNPASTNPDVFCVPVGSVGNLTEFWAGALTNSSWVQNLDWNNHASDVYGYQCWNSLGIYQTNTGGYASLELPISSNSDQVRDAASLVNNERESEMGFTAIGTGMRLSRQVFARIPTSGAPRVLMVLTDGKNNRGETTNTISADLHSDGVTVYSVGVGSLNQAILEEISGDASRVFSVDTLDQIESLLDILVAETCMVAGSNYSTPVCQEVPPPVDNVPPTVEITADTQDGIVPVEVIITVTITDPDGYPTNLTVDWGNGETSENPNGGTFTRVYNSSGTYEISVECTDNGNGVGNASTQIVLVDNQPPTGSLTVSPTSGTLPVEVTYSVSASDVDGEIVDITIDFDDGQGSSNSSGNHTYLTPGNYNLTALITDDKGGQLLLKEEIYVNSPPTGSLSLNPVVGIAPQEVQATVSANDEEGEVTLNLDWGDGTSELVSIGDHTHNYTTNGTFSVILTITDSDAAVLQITESLFLAQNSEPEVIVIVGSNGTEVTVEVQATDHDGNVTDITIDFGDGTVITGSTGNETHTYGDPGTYNLTVTVTDDKGGSTTVTQEVFVNNQPNANLSLNPSSGIAPQTVQATIVASDPDGVVTATIDWGDGTLETVSSGIFSHTYPNNGTYTVVLRVTDTHNATAVDTELLTLVQNVDPNGSLWISGSFGTETLEVDVVVSANDPDGNITDITIDFGDGTVISGSSGTENHTYTSPGIYNLSVIITDDKNGTKVLQETIRVNTAPIVTLEITPDTGVVPEKVWASVHTSDAEGLVITTIDWGDGTLQLLPASGNFSHIYNTSGNFTITVTATDSDNATRTQDRQLSLIANTDPRAVLNVNPLVGLIPLQVTADGSASSDDQSSITFDWNFGEFSSRAAFGGSVNNSVVDHTYTTPGKFTVTLIVTDSKGATDQDTEQVTALLGSTGGEDPDPDDSFNCTEIQGVTVCPSIQVAGVCVNRFQNQAAFWVHNMVNWDLTIPMGETNSLSISPDSETHRDPPTTSFPGNEKQWFWIPWNNQIISWRIVDPLTEMEAVGRVSPTARACYPSENGNLQAALKVEGCSSAAAELKSLWTLF